MVRNYDSSRRKEAAGHTREAILSAAFALHGQGIFDLESLARDANVSVSTVRKYFPNRGRLFEGCASYGLQLAPMPDFAGLAAMADPRERLAATVHQAFALHESLLGQVWGACKMEDESPVLGETLRQLNGAVDALVETAIAAWPGRGDEAEEFRGLITGMLSPLAYRGLRINGGLSSAQSTSRVTRLLLDAFETSPGHDAGEPAHH